MVSNRYYLISAILSPLFGNKVLEKHQNQLTRRWKILGVATMHSVQGLILVRAGKRDGWGAGKGGH